jgi:hypothetical protein
MAWVVPPPLESRENYPNLLGLYIPSTETMMRKEIGVI